MRAEMKNEIITLPKIMDKRGNLSFIESERHIPFAIKRAYWIYDVPGGAQRGGHAFHESKEFIIALSGSFDVKLDDGNNVNMYHLCRSYYGLLVRERTWRQLDNFSTNSLALVLSSTDYSPDDYIRDYNDFVEALK
jgi:hypothetical protein